ncbi:tRNA 2'-phosphotransferase 1-like isoform X1 [Tripterygium wilfordii]|uniref:2'-phosphotransferase n=1 Tax=Tripterygium wilfordii TaxID=458696 RepID=A0A7J7CC14_TRIWF|nr:tRNA 2'-phosphotransferase 1-like isoform X2 [Tripterygium wilfordii]KAF5731659.1 tRNA 2'-phosphotransferase 1-like isoform X1 [Tripterygium wilfordii]
MSCRRRCVPSPPPSILFTGCGIRILRCCSIYLKPVYAPAQSHLTKSCSFASIYNTNQKKNMSSSFGSFALSSRSVGRGRGLETKNDRERSRGRGGGSGKDKIDSLGRLLTRILRHQASELNLNMRSDGFVKVQDLRKINLKTFANIPLKLHTIEDIKEAVRKDNKQRFSLLEENGELLIRANQGHTLTTVESESLLKPILSAEEVPVCVHGTYKKNLDSILESGLGHMQRLHVHFSCGLPTDGEVISGMRRNVNILIFLDVRKALEDGMKLYISDNKVVLTEGFDDVVPVKYFEKTESWPDRQPIPILNL